MRHTESLWKARNVPSLVKIGLALIAFPEPVVSDAIGTIAISIGLVQAKVRNSSLYIDDVPSAFQNVIESIGTIKRALNQ